MNSNWKNKIKPNTVIPDGQSMSIDVINMYHRCILCTKFAATNTGIITCKRYDKLGCSMYDINKCQHFDPDWDEIRKRDPLGRGI